jgi:hypothetical protein
MGNLQATAIAIIVSVVLLAGYNFLGKTASEQTNDVRYGVQFASVVQAARKFAYSQRASIIATVTGNGGAAAVFHVADMVAANALDPSAVGVPNTPTGGSYCLEFRTYNGGANLQGVLTVVGEAKPLSMVDAGFASQATGTSFTGLIDANNNASYPGGSQPLSAFTGGGVCAPVANALAAVITDTDSVTTGIYLARVSTGTPSDNRMTVDEDLGGNNLLNGNAINGVTGVFTTSVTTIDYFNTSDRNAKHDIRPISHPWPLLASITGSSWNWNDTGRPDDGVIAQDVQKTMPELVRRDPATGRLVVNYNGLIAPLLEEVKWQHREIERLTARIEAGQ